MSPAWKKIHQQEKLNHHFPELTAKNNLKQWFWNLTCQRSAVALIVVANIVAGFFYLTQTNRTATYGYEIKGWENELAQLQEANSKLNLDYIKLESMDRIVANSKSLNMVPADNVEIINVGDNTIALNR